MTDAVFVVGALGVVFIGTLLLLSRSSVLHRLTHSPFVQALTLVVAAVFVVALLAT